MICKIIFATISLFLTSLTVFGQTSYKGLTPGKSNKADVARVLGQPVKKISETLVEYRPQPLTGRVYVQYREGSTIVERIEVLCRLPNSNCNNFLKGINLSLPDSADEVSGSEGESNRYSLYFGPPHYVVTVQDDNSLTENAGNPDTANVIPDRVAFYSRELYEAKVEEVKEANVARAEEDQKKRESEPSQIGAAAGAIIDSIQREGSKATVGAIIGGTHDQSSAGPVSGRWTGSWTNSKGESGNSTVTINEHRRRVTGTTDRITGDEDGWIIEDGQRSGNVLTWVYRNKNNGCRGYSVRWEISPDGRTANGTYKVVDGCKQDVYTGTYLNYRRQD